MLRRAQGPVFPLGIHFAVVMSPYNFNTTNQLANVWNVNSTGNLNNNNVTNTGNGLRPAISLNFSKEK